MTQYRTNNPLGSMVPRDLYDNAQNIDNWSNGPEPFYEDRFGVMRRSFSGMNFEFEAGQDGRNAAFDQSQVDKEGRFQAFLVSAGYVSKGDYAADVVLLERNEYVAVDAATTGTTAGLYRPNAEAVLPLTLTGTWATDETSLVLLGDDVLRQELAGSAGASHVGYGGGTVADALDALSDLPSKVAKRVSDFATVQDAVDASAGGTLIFDVPVTVTSMVTLPSIIRLVVQELITFTGDQDYWFYADSPQAIVITEWRSTQSNPFSGRTKYNRQLRIDSPTLFSIDYAEIDEASTGIHCLFGEVFRAGIIKLTNLRGTEAQYGYGVNSSARISRINTVIAENDAPGDGRHVIYINGDAWEDVDIGSVRCKNIHRNPLNIFQTSVTAKARFKLGSFYADGCNIGAPNNTTSCVHFPEPTSPDVKVDIGDIHVVRSVGAVSSASALSGGIYSLNSFNVDNVTVDSPAPGSQWQVMIRGSKRPRVGFVQSTELPTGSQGLLRFRECLDGLVETAILEGAVGTGAVNILDGSATIGRIDSPGVPPVLATNSTIKSLNLFNDSFVNVGDSATPSVSGIKKAFNAAGSAVSITDFLNGVDGQELIFVASSGNTTIVHNSNAGGITTKSGADVVLSGRGRIHLVRFGPRWLEV